MSSRAFLATGAFCLAFLGMVEALCSGEPAFAPLPNGHKACVNDPADGRNLELYLVFSGECDQHATWYNSVVFWGTDDERTTAEALETYTLPTGPTSGTMTFHFDVPVTALKPGEVAGMRGYAQDDENWRRLDYYVDWVQEFTPGAGPGSPDTAVAHETVTTITTSTVTDTVQETTTLSATVTPALATKTVTAPRSTVTSEITITPLPRIITKRSVSTVTTSVTCIDDRRHRDRSEERSSPERDVAGSHASNMSPRQDASPGSYVAPGCGGDTAEPKEFTSTITETHTAFVSTTTTTVETASAVVSSGAEGTTTVTPTRVKRHFTIADRPTQTITRVYTTTQSVYPLGRDTRRCRPRHGRAANS